MLSLSVWFLFSIFFGSFSGFFDNPGVGAKPPKKYDSKQIFTAICIGTLEGIEAGIGFSIIFTIWIVFLDALSSWIAPTLHVSFIKLSIPQSFGELITIAKLPMILGAGFGSHAGVSNYLLESDSMLKAKIFASGIYTIIALSQFIIVGGTLLGFVMIGLSLLGNTQCTHDPRLRGGISFLLAFALTTLLSNRWFHGNAPTEKITLTIVCGSILFSCFMILDTLLFC